MKLFKTLIVVGCVANLLSCATPAKTVKVSEEPDNYSQPNMDNYMTIPLSDDEKAMLEQDKIIMQTVSSVNQINAVQGSQEDSQSHSSFADIFPDAVPIPPMLYWINDNAKSIAQIKALLNNGTDINASYEYFGKRGYTALHVASQEGYMNTVKFLIEHGANPNLKLETGETPADLAEATHPEVANYLRALMD